MERRLAAIMATDVVGYSRLIRADEEGTLAALKALRADLIDPKIAEHHGRIVKLMGDGMLVEFASVVDAVHAAVETQQAVSYHNSDIPADKRIELRIGINLGDVVIDGDDIQGDGVNVAARLEGMAESGGICVSGMVYEEVRDRTDFAFEDLGEQEVKNIDRPVRVWRWVAGDGAASAEPLGATEPLPLPDKQSIAVLPFDNLSGDPEQAYFSDGITEDITTELSRFHDLHVVARNSSYVYRGRAADVRDVGRVLGVCYVVEGSVRKAGGRIRVTTQLIDAVSGHHLWAERYDRELEDIFAIQDEIIETIVSTIVGRVEDHARQRAKRKSTQSLEAYDYVLRGDEELLEYTKERSAKAKELYFKAIELDPVYARAHAGIAFAFLSDWGFLWSETPDEALDRAVEYARKAVSLDNAESRSHWVLAYVLVFHQDYAEARVHQKRAVALNPNDADVLAKMGYVLPLLGECEEAIGLVEKAIRLNPLHPVWYNSFLGMAFFAARRYREAIAAFEKSSNAYPEDGAWMAATFARMQSLEAAQRTMKTFLQSAGPEPWWSNVPASAQVIERDPNGLLTYMSYMYPYKKRDDIDHLLGGLRIAGQPE